MDKCWVPRGVESRVASCDSLCLPVATIPCRRLPAVRHLALCTSPLVTPNSVVVTLVTLFITEVDVAKNGHHLTPSSHPDISHLPQCFVLNSLFFTSTSLHLFFWIRSVTLLVRLVVERWEGWVVGVVALFCYDVDVSRFV